MPEPTTVLDSTTSMKQKSVNAVYLAFDFGMRRTGVAVGQSITGTATPLLTLNHPRGEPSWTEIDTLMTAWKPVSLIVGEPIIHEQVLHEQTEGQTTDSENPLLVAMSDFCEKLTSRYALPVFRIDESFTSVAAQSELRDSRSRGRKKRVNKNEVDALAAAIMLEAWMSEAISQIKDEPL